METAHDRRKRKLEELCSREGGIKAVADRTGVNPATLDQILKGTLLPPKQDGSRSPRGVGNDLARKLEAAFRLGTGWFDSAEPSAQVLPYALTGSTSEPANVFENIGHGADRHEYAYPINTQGMAAVMATAKVGADGFYEEEKFEGEEGGWVPDMGTAGSYALRIRGDGMSPVIESGSYVLVAKGVTAQPGERVVVRLRDGRQAIRKLLYSRDGELHVMPVQGGAAQTFEEGAVESVHPILAVVEARSWRAARVDEVRQRRALPTPTRGGNRRLGDGQEEEGVA